MSINTQKYIFFFWAGYLELISQKSPWFSEI